MNRKQLALPIVVVEDHVLENFSSQVNSTKGWVLD